MSFVVNFQSPGISCVLLYKTPFLFMDLIHINNYYIPDGNKKLNASQIPFTPLHGRLAPRLKWQDDHENTRGDKQCTAGVYWCRSLEVRKHGDDGLPNDG